MQGFTAIDLSPQCEIRLKAYYQYELLERLDSAADLIGLCSGALWRDAEVFELPLLESGLSLRWRACAPTAGIAVVHEAGQTLSLSLLASGLDPTADQLTIQALQQHVVRQLRDTQFEPAFDLIELWQRPLLATIGFFAPEGEVDRHIFALVDRCFAAAYFRRLELA